MRHHALQKNFSSQIDLSHLLSYQRWSCIASIIDQKSTLLAGIGMYKIYTPIILVAGLYERRRQGVIPGGQLTFSLEYPSPSLEKKRKKKKNF